MPDEAHKWTDEQIEQLQKEFGKTYRQAAIEMRAKLGKHMREFEKDNEDWKKRVKNDPSLEPDYKKWLKARAADKKWISGMCSTLVNDAVRADQIAADHIYNAVPYVFAENANRAAFSIQEGIGRKVGGFSLYDQDTVRRLIAEESDLIPAVVKPNFDKKKDTKWNRQKFTSAITQSILQGESVEHTADRLGRVLDMDESTATRTARTALTSAENAGRLTSYRRANDLGIKCESQWIATIDGDTRKTHILLDGERAPVGEKFHVPGYGPKYDIEYPGDASALPEMVWNCRCTTIAYFSDSPEVYEDRWSDLPEGMTYDDWKESARIG